MVTELSIKQDYILFLFSEFSKIYNKKVKIVYKIIFIKNKNKTSPMMILNTKINRASMFYNYT